VGAGEGGNDVRGNGDAAHDAVGYESWRSSARGLLRHTRMYARADHPASLRLLPRLRKAHGRGRVVSLATRPRFALDCPFRHRRAPASGSRLPVACTHVQEVRSHYLTVRTR
jgi:hypothetical protein